MADKHMKRINQYLQDLLEEKDYLSENVERIIKHASHQVKSLTKTQAPSSEKEKVLTFLTKSLTLLSELNSTILKCLESIPDEPETPQENSRTHINEVEEYYKGSDIVPIKDLPKGPANEGPKIPNTQVQNDFYYRKPLNETTLKAICSTIIKDQKQETAAGTIKPESLIQENKNPEESDTVSTVSTSTFCHPLSRLQPPMEIPEEYDSRDLETVRETMTYIKEKLGLESRDFAKMSNHYNKDQNYRFEEPVKESVTYAEAARTETVATQVKIEVNDVATRQVPEKVVNRELPVVPPRSTGAIKKQKVNQGDLMEVTCNPPPEKESCDKVTFWLTNNEKKMSDQFVDRTAKSAVEKLGEIKRHDRNEEVWEKIKDDVPELNFVPATKVIKNIWSSSSSEKSSKVNSPRKSKAIKVPKFYVIKSMEPPTVGTICVFSHIVSPSEFYLQVCNDKNSFNEDLIRYKLDIKFSKSESPFRTKQAAQESLKEFCCGYVLKGKSWYRLRVLDWKLEILSDEVDIQAVDYGFKCSTSYKYLRELTDDIANIPMLSIKCHFPLLYPPGSTYLNRLTTWPDKSREGFEEIVNLHSESHVADVSFFEVVFAELEGDSLGVDLQDHQHKHSDTLGRFLVDMYLATEIIDEYEENPELGSFLDDLDNLENADNQNEYLFGYDAKDEMRICQFTRKDGTCYKGKNCKLEHVVLKDGHTTDKQAIFYTPTSSLILPVKGDVIQVLPTSYLDPCTYLVQLVRNPVKFGEGSNMIMDNEIATLIKAMNHSKMISKYEPYKISPALGEFLLAFQPASNQWVRAVVRMLCVNDDESLLEVYSVDFGDEFYVNTKNIRQMPEQFIHLPCQIVPVYLEKFQRRNNYDEQKWKRFFNKHISYKLFLAHIRSNEPPIKVQLETLKGADIGPTLVKEQLAEPKTMDWCINDNVKLALE